MAKGSNVGRNPPQLPLGQRLVNPKVPKSPHSRKFLPKMIVKSTYKGK